jgi:multidrug efflux pump subunit AcrA (membrane-fusion protein)
MNFQGLYLMREVTDSGGMPPEQLIAMDVPEDFTGGPALFDRPDWELRPGQLVPVLLENEAPQPGFYVPMDVIRSGKEGSGTIFVLADGKVKATPIKMAGQVGELVRVEGAGLRAGVEVVADHIHFLQDGEAVRVAGRRELAR